MNFILEKSSFSQAQTLYVKNIFEVLHIKSSSTAIKECNFTNNYRLPLYINNSSTEIYHTNFINNKRDRDRRNQLPSGGTLLIENTEYSHY